MDSIGIALLHRLLRTPESEWKRLIMNATLPNPSGSYRGSYYATGLAAIRAHAARRQTEEQLHERAAELRTRGDREGGRRGARWTNNARIIDDYLEFSFSPGRTRVLPLSKLTVNVENVRFGVMPDLHAANGPKEKFFKFYCSAKRPGPLQSERHRLIAQLAYEATKDVIQGIEPDDIRIIDLARATLLPGAAARSSLMDDLRRVAKRVNDLARDGTIPRHSS